MCVWEAWLAGVFRQGTCLHTGFSLAANYFILVMLLVYTLHVSGWWLGVTLDFRGCLIVSGGIFFLLPQEGDQFHKGKVCESEVPLYVSELCTQPQSSWISVKMLRFRGATPSSTQTGLGLFSGSAARINWAKNDVKFNHSLEKCWIKEASRVNYQTRFSHQKPERLSLEDPGEQGRAGGGSE